MFFQGSIKSYKKISSPKVTKHRPLNTTSKQRPVCKLLFRYRQIYCMIVKYYYKYVAMATQQESHDFCFVSLTPADQFCLYILCSQWYNDIFTQFGSTWLKALVEIVQWSKNQVICFWKLSKLYMKSQFSGFCRDINNTF